MQDETTRSRCHRLSTYRLSRPLTEIGAFLDSITSNTGKLRLAEILFSLRLGWRALETTARGIDLKKPWDVEGKGRIRGRPRSASRLDIQGHDAPQLQQPSNAIASGNRKCKRCSTCYMEEPLSLDYLLLLPLALTASPAYQANVPKRACQMCKISQPDIVASSNQDVQKPPPHPNTAFSHVRSEEAPSASQKCKKLSRGRQHTGCRASTSPQIPRVQKPGLNARNR